MDNSAKSSFSFCAVSRRALRRNSPHFRLANAPLLLFFQGSLLGGPEMRSEEHRPRIRRQNHQHQKALGERSVSGFAQLGCDQ